MTVVIDNLVVSRVVCVGHLASTTALANDSMQPAVSEPIHIWSLLVIPIDVVPCGDMCSGHSIWNNGVACVWPVYKLCS